MRFLKLVNQYFLSPPPLAASLPPPTSSTLPSLSPPTLPPPPPNYLPPLASPTTTLSNLLNHPTISPGPLLQTALNKTGIKPDKPLLLKLFDRFDSSPKTVLALFEWAEKQNGFECCVEVLNKVVNIVGKSRDFECVWGLVLDRIGNKGLVNLDTFGIVIRRYARAGMPLQSIQTYEFASRLEFISEADVEQSMFGLLLDSFCKEGHMRVAMDYFNKLKYQGRTFASSTRSYNILLNGWFRCRKLKQAERLWSEMKRENVKPTVVTYGTLVEGLCRMRRVEMAMDLISEMKSEGIEPNVIVYNPIIDALGEAGKLKEALGFMERLSVLKSGPTISTYNSLVKGFCKAGDIEGAGKILKEMISGGCIPTSTTYSYFFKYFSRTGKVEEGLNLYTKLMDSGYVPDLLTYHLLVKMLCEQERLDFAIQVTKEMRERGYDMDLATCTMLIHLMCRMHRFDDAFKEFEYMIRRGIVPQYLTFERLGSELKKRGLTEKLQQLYDLMGSVPHSTKLPDTYRREGEQARKLSILQKARAVSDILKTTNNPRELVKRKYSLNPPILSANRTVQD
ncbi:hypothetical protein Leryth_016303 [Lithospermum erythrorhizon]|nr:hypothetical protein Leryth_016303 [Lithospermum erythrorhizon]